jgi:hypothetical protein
MTTGLRSERGVVLVIVLLGLSLLVAAGLGLTLSSSVSRMSAANAMESVMLAAAAESAIELAARELGKVDLDGVLSGAAVSGLVDGPPGVRTIAPGVTIDLNTLSNQITCGKLALCTDAQVQQTTVDRPWGPNNPRWRLFIHQPLQPPPSVPAAPDPYVVAWIGDDAREDDDDPSVDGAGADQEGRYIVRVRAEAFGPRGGRRAIEAELVRRCVEGAQGPVCLPGSRVQSWRAVSELP